MHHYIFSDGDLLKSCCCFDPSAPVKSRISEIADMNYARKHHSLIVANGKLYTIGGWVKICPKCIAFMFYSLFYNKSTRNEDNVRHIEAYDPNVDKWTVVGKIDLRKLR